MPLAEFTPAFATAAATAEALITRKISVTELVRLTFDRIDRHDQRLNAIVWWPACPQRWRRWAGRRPGCRSGSKSWRRCGKTARRSSWQR
jgi:hypothetical protein